MQTHAGNCERTTAAEGIPQIVSLVAAMRVIAIANDLSLLERSLTVARNPLRPVEIDLAARAPFGFAFTEGNEATFLVPRGHRFVIEHMSISCWAENDRVDVQLETRSSHMFRSLSLTNWPESPSPNTNLELRADHRPILVAESAANTFLFSNGQLHNSSSVPPDTYVQIWGYLEPANDAQVA